MIVRIYYPEQEKAVEGEELKGTQGGLVKERRSVLIDCDVINYSETDEDWRMICMKNGEVIRDKSFPVESKAVAYVMEGGKTVDRLPRR